MGRTDWAETAQRAVAALERIATALEADVIEPELGLADPNLVAASIYSAAATRLRGILDSETANGFERNQNLRNFSAELEKKAYQHAQAVNNGAS
jgi:hypothetical protein